jgi:hypothetical protein
LPRRRLWPWPLAIVLFVWTLTTHGKYSDSGDEPHYLIIAESLVSDFDFDLANNYAGGSARWFGADGLEHGPHALQTKHGALWSVHDFGLPVLLLPVYAAATRASLLMPDSWLTAMKQPRGLFAYSLVSVTMTIATALAAALLIVGLEHRTSPGLARAIGMAVALSPPVVSHSFLVFGETPALWATCAAVWLVCLRADELTRVRVLAVIIAVGLTPWLHRKYSLYSLAVIAWIVYVHRDWFRAQAHGWLAAVAIASVLPQIALHAVTLWAWGHLGGPQMVNSLPFTPSLIVRGALGLLFDRERGLLGYAPIYLLAPACFAIAWREHRAVLAVAATLYFPMAAYVNWDAGFSPAARYIVPLMPLLAFPAARALQNVALRRLIWPVVAFQAAICVVIWQWPRTMWPKELGTNQALDKIPLIGPAWSALLPSLHTGDAITAAIPVVVVVVCVTVAIVAYSRRQSTRASW